MHAHTSEPIAESSAVARTSQSPIHQRLADPLCLLAVMLIAGFGVATRLRIGWVPSDEGTLATGALRVLHGQLPQRDFAEIYTGGLSLLHALAFRLFGTNLFSLRLCVFLFFLAWLPTVYSIARRFLTPIWAALFTLTAVAWSYPNYVAAMPSWYNLFFATFGAFTLLRFLETRSRRWLILAGLFGGLSILVKIIGLYYVAAALFFLLFLEQEGSPANDDTLPSSAPETTPRTYRLTCAALLFLFLTVLTRMVWPQLQIGEFFHFLLPSYTCVGLLLLRERRPAFRTSIQRFSALLQFVLPFLLGVLLPILIFLLPYLSSHSVISLLHGVACSVTTRLVDLGGVTHPPAIDLAYYPFLILGLLAIGMYSPLGSRPAIFLPIAGGLGGLVAAYALFPGSHDALQDIWLMLGNLTPVIVLAGAALLMQHPERHGPEVSLRRQRLMLLLSIAAVCSLVQFPFPYITYFCYTAPLTLLAVLACVGMEPRPAGKPLLATLCLFLLGLGLTTMVARHWFSPDMNLNALHPEHLPRAGELLVDDTTPDYDRIVPLLQSHSPNGLLYAGNDCPELYFLSGLRNPTRDDTGSPDSEVINALASGALQVVALNDRSFFAKSATSSTLRSEVAHFLQHSETVGRFTIYWR